ncbi:beta-hydroxyacid dehydrogenase, 3-hydroxyisobutyrate dehydrogenase [Thioflavicoccus mobilis 8321]|uniref:Beta-hydroxyacid dehydrogenase, 3-hydroxyisobutyrate dehydrogenase n=1 Tax=Thioflavicoccus mobilis 8321 TaxID=765912 RepID=L0GUI3_9GAMM|nr:NAD(P)-dependent oxidoreductase [Thioflavicoccus mobilis]AGA89010.1 beta-hydroxyacid dehydrogenase, 3-hydroxyisobutyrate dehydrogenase [Thioflavicoccus mobilis 8321]
MKIAVLGLGLMGTAIARRLHEQGFAVVGWNRSPGAAEALAGEGIATAASPGEAIAMADLVALLLADADAIAETLAPPTTEALAGRILVQMGTIAPDESRDLAARIAAAGAEYLEAPVLGSLPEAGAGRLLIMAGGEADLFERCRPFLAALGESPQRIGAVGQAAALKLAMNQLIAGLTATFAASLGLVRREGIAVDQFMDLLRGSALYAPTFDKKLDKYLAHDYGSANFPLKHLLKDVRLFHRTAGQAGIDNAPIAALEAACLRGIAAGHGDEDYSALYEALVPR